MRISDWSSDVCSSDLAVAEYLCEQGLNAPTIIARDLAQGLLLIEDFGDVRGAEPARDSKAVVVEIDHDDASRRVELRGEQGRKPDRTSTYDRTAAPRGSEQRPVGKGCVRQGKSRWAPSHKKKKK